MKLIDYSNPYSFASRMRKKRMRYLTELVQVIPQKTRAQGINICDIGGTESYWMNFPFHHFAGVQFTISLINLSYPSYDVEIKLPDGVSIVKEIGNACDLSCYGNNQFHIAHSNSVIEHVGTWPKRKLMANEIQRVGEYFFLQTPNFWFPIEPHFLVPFYPWLPRPVRLRILRAKGRSAEEAIVADENIRLLTKNDMRLLFNDAELITERFMGLPKSIIVRSRV